MYTFYICIYVNMYVGSHGWAYMCVGHKYTYFTHVCIYIFECMHACMHVCICIYHISMYSLKYVYRQTYMSI